LLRIVDHFSLNMSLTLGEVGVVKILILYFIWDIILKIVVKDIYE